MSKNLTSTAVPFSFEKYNVHVINQDGETWFVAADVCNVLDLRNSRSSIALLDEDEKGVHSMDTPGGEQKVTIINESGLYALVLRSRKPEAKRFRKWVTSEVLPAIRKTGRYSLSITKEQQGELATLIAERFPEGRHRPYAWGRFNNHFRLASYKDLPAARFDEACEYIRTMPEKEPFLPVLPFGDRDQYRTLKERAQKYIHDCILHAKNESKGVWPEMDIPDDVLAGLVAQHLPHVGFYLDIDYNGGVSVKVRQSPYKGLAKAIADPGNIGLQDAVIEEIGQACVTALAHRAKRREAVIHTARG